MQVPASMRTLSQKTLCPSTAHLIQQKLAWALTKLCLDWGFKGTPTVQLSAHHVGFMQVPLVIANPAPMAMVENFYSPGASS